MHQHFRTFRLYLSLILIAQLTLPSALLAQQAQLPGFYGSASNLPEVASNALPQIKADGLLQGVAGLSTTRTNQLTVHQNQPKAIIDWESFNIGKDAWTHFDQRGNTDWAALNRIYDQNPSLIYGKLTADGKIYLINQNGILFGPNSQTNVHALTASSLDISKEDFEDNLLHFTGDDARGPVSNSGDIQAGTGGFVYLVSPEVENSGTINAPAGQVALIAGNDAEIVLLDRTFPYIYVTPGEKGTAVNAETGSIAADSGLAGMYGKNVNQKGYIRSITAITNNGHIELKASEKVTTGADSRTLSPISDDTEKVHSSFELTGGEVEISGLDQYDPTKENKNQTTSTGIIEHGGEITAKSGSITMDATDRIYLDAGSSLDVSGEWVDRSTESVAIDVQLNSVELKNDYSQKDGILQGETITVLPQEGSSIGDISVYLQGEYLTAREMATAGGRIELQTENGDIIIRDGYNGKDAAQIDFSGGGTRVSDGSYNITKLVSGNKVYDISEAPESIQYETIANYQEFTNERYGTIDRYEGLYFGGATPLFDRVSGYIQGDDAGTLSLIAQGIVLDGTLLGSATAGLYQTEVEIPVELYGNYTLQTASNVKAPRGGELFIGPEDPLTASGNSVDYIVDEVVIVKDAQVLPEDFSVGTDLKTVSIDGSQPYLSEFQNDQRELYRTVISADKLSAVGLSNLTVQSNTKITVDKDAELILYPGGLRLKSTDTSVVGLAPEYWDTAPAYLELSARALEYNGNIDVPGGEVNFIITDTLTSEMNSAEEQIELVDRVFMSNGARVVVAGERIDNSLSEDIGELKNGFIDGGSIRVTDNTQYGGELILGTDFLLDVSGGYEVAPNGNVAAGSAGSIELKGKSLVLEADLRGHSLIGETGGAITLHTDTIIIDQEGPLLFPGFGFDDELPDDLQEQLVLKQDQLADTGFSDITLKSYKDLTFASDTLLEPSCIKMAYPEPAAANLAVGGNLNPEEPINIQGLTIDGENEYVKVPLEYLGDSGITASAGQPVVSSQAVSNEIDTYTVYVQPNATIKVAPEGHITLSGLMADIAGSLIAPSGEINLTASGDLRDLIIRSESIISATGYNRKIRESYIAERGYQYDILDGGAVTLTANSGSILMETGSRIDISGSQPVNGIVYETGGGITTKTMAANAGSLTLRYLNELTLNGELIGDAKNDAVHGASLSIIKENLNYSMTVSQNDFNRYIADGFDAVSLSSLKGLVFSGNINIDEDEAGKPLLRRLTLDAPLISGNETDQKISFDATDIILANTQAKYGNSSEQISYLNLVDDTQSLDAGDGSSGLTLSGEYLEITGSVAVSGFNNISLDVTRDIQLTDDVYYNNANQLIWKGQLRTPGNLSIRAARIYPTTQSDFILASDEGRITILPGNSNTDGPIVSAGGALTLAANEIDHRGFLAAPMGQIQFKGPDLLDDDDRSSTVFLANGSITSVTAEGVTQYGYLDNDANWYVTIKPREWTSTTVVDYELLESLPEKSVTITGDTVVMQTGALIDFSGGGTIYSAKFIPGTNGLENPLTADNTYVIVPGIDYPGAAIQLTEGSGLPPGTYSLLPEEYAFISGAYVVENLGSINKSGGAALYTDDGYSIMVGYQTEAGTDFTTAVPEMYSIRLASEVIEQSEFNVSTMISGSGGSLDIKGTTTVLEGNFKSNAIAGYRGGILALSGAKSSIIKSTVTLGEGYGFDDIAGLIEPYVNTAQTLDTTVSESNLSELYIGTLSLTEEVIIAEGAAVNAPYIQLSADNGIRLEKNSKLMGTGADSEVVFNTPAGDFEMASGSSVADFSTVEIKAGSALFNGELTSNEGTLVITTDNMVATPEDYQESDPDTFYLLTGTWAGFSGFDNLELNADTSLTLAGGTFFEVAETLTMNSPAILFQDANEISDVGINAREIYLVNTTGADETVSHPEMNGHLVLNAKETMGIGHGDVYLGGFSEIDVECKNEEILGDVLLRGDGSLIADGDLTFTAARVISSFYEESDGETDQTVFESPLFLVQAGNDLEGYHTISITGNGSTTNLADSSYGGTLDFVGDAIHLSGSGIGATGGWVTLTAYEDETGGQSITLSDSAFIDVSGSDYASGGRVTLDSNAGSIVIGKNSFIDVSAGNQGDAGILKLLSPQAEIRIDGEILGHAAGGTGGAFYMDSHQILETDIAPLLDILENGGFDHRFDLRLRTGDFKLVQEETVHADQVKITADTGNVLIEGIIDVSGASGGNVEINAGNEIALAKESEINASAKEDGADAGSVYLNAANINFEKDSMIIVSSEGGTGGDVHFRSLQSDTGDDVQANLAGTVSGASKVLLEGVRVYQDEDGSITSTDIDGFHGDADDFLANSEAIQNRLISVDGLTIEGGTAENIQIVPGIELQSTGDLTLNAKWDLTERNRSDQGGYITLRAEGNLILNQSLVDHPTVVDVYNYEYINLNDETTVLPNAWGFNLIAGADPESSDVQSTIAGQGDLIFSNDQVVYTENNTIRFAAGQDMIFYGVVFSDDPTYAYMVNAAMRYNLGSYNGDIQGHVGRDLILMNNAAIQSAIGDIDISVGRNLYMQLNDAAGSAIRTTGTGSIDELTYADWNYADTHDGGNIKLDVQQQLQMGDVDLNEIYQGIEQENHIPFYNGTAHLKYWDNLYVKELGSGVTLSEWSADYAYGFFSSSAGGPTTTGGVATMGGGSVSICAGAAIHGQIGTFKSGDLSVFSNGDLSGYFQIADGQGDIAAMGNITSPDKNAAQKFYAYSTSLAIFDARAAVTAGGSIDFGTIYNPTFPKTYAEYSANGSLSRYLDYGETASVSLTAIRGNLALSGSFWSGQFTGIGAEGKSYRVLPSTVALFSGGDIQLGSSMGGDFVLSPSSYGNLTIHADGSISGLYQESTYNQLERAVIRMSDMDPQDIYRLTVAGDTDDPLNDLFASETLDSVHRKGNPLHSEDPNSISIYAGEDIRELEIIAAKQTSVYADGDISGVYFFGQNINEDDETVIHAGGSIDLQSLTSPSLEDTGFINAGPGLFVVESGASIDLGTTQGIQNVGNAFYSALEETNGFLSVIAGFDLDISLDRVATFFDQIREYGKEYSEKLADGDISGAAETVAEAETNLIDPFFQGKEKGDGNIDMTSSSIQTIAEECDLFVFANGVVNVGLTAIPDPLEIASGEAYQTDTGFFTTKGGGINIFSVGDVNVNESRIMTFRGGDITVWSDEGDINAGRGSKTAINAGSPTSVPVYDDDGDIIEIEIEWEAPSVGSGIRTLTYDPDGFQRPLEAPPAGDAFLFAPKGIIDAGEAGISASNVILGATEVLNAENISFSLGSVGVPSGAEGADIGALSGAAAAMGETSKIAEESTALKSAQERMEEYTKTLSDTLVPKWIAVEVIGFDKDEEAKKEE